MQTCPRCGSKYVALPDFAEVTVASLQTGGLPPAIPLWRLSQCRNCDLTWVSEHAGIRRMLTRD